MGAAALKEVEAAAAAFAQKLERIREVKAAQEPSREAEVTSELAAGAEETKQAVTEGAM